MGRTDSFARKKDRSPAERPASLTSESVLEDYRLMYRSRQASLLGRKEVFGGKAKFGIFGDGKEAAQVAMSRFFKKGDFRSGYYRDQTFMFATGMTTIGQFFAQLYANADVDAEPPAHGITRARFRAGRGARASPLRRPRGRPPRRRP